MMTDAGVHDCTRLHLLCHGREYHIGKLKCSVVCGVGGAPPRYAMAFSLASTSATLATRSGRSVSRRF